MTAIGLLRALAVACVPAWALTPSLVLAAHADDPYRNVDHSDNKGNDIGDSQVAGVNRSQLNETYRGRVELRGPAANSPTAQTPPAYAPR